MKRAFISLLLVLIGASQSAYATLNTTLPQWQPGVRGDLAVEASGFLREANYRNPDKVAIEMSEDGAYSPLNQAWEKTHQGNWRIEEQRYAFDAVLAGIDYHRQDVIERGEKIFDWGFRQEKPDGSFDCADSFHSASFFIEAAAHAALLLEASGMREQNQAWVDRISPKLRLAVLWMMNPANESRGRAHDAPYTHRFYLDADAIGETGVLLHDAAMIEHSKSYVRAGIARQDASGFNPEKGGSDTSYHSVGLMFALYYYTLVADDGTRRELRPMVERGLRWLKGRLREDGTVDQTGNTRTGFGQERGPNGTLKFMSYGSAWRAAWYWAAITGDTQWAQMAQALYSGNQVEQKQRQQAAQSF